MLAREIKKERIVKKILAHIKKTSAKDMKERLHVRTHILAVNEESLIRHAGAQVVSLSGELIDGVDLTALSTSLGRVLYTKMISYANALVARTSSSLGAKKINPSTKEGKLILARAKIRGVSGATSIYEFTPKNDSIVYHIIKQNIFTKVNAVAYKILRPYLREGTDAKKLSIVLDVGHLYQSSGSFRNIVHQLKEYIGETKVPAKIKAEMNILLLKYANMNMANAVSKYESEDWALGIELNRNVSMKNFRVDAAIVITPQSAHLNRKDILLMEVALNRVLKETASELAELVLWETTGSPTVHKSVETLLMDATISALIKGHKNRDSKGRFISKKELLKGLKTVLPVTGKATAWRALGRKSALGTAVDNLLGIKSILNTYMFEHMQRNMGKGASKTVLNYRTGRLAGSAEVEQVHSTRAGEIAMTVNYMQKPYQTFAPGGAQGDPTTRNPKRLVDKSIRQILKERLNLTLNLVSTLGGANAEHGIP